MFEVADNRRTGKSLYILTSYSSHVDLFSAEESTTIETSIHSMISHLDKAAQHSSDPADAPPLTITHMVPTGGRGRPRYELDPVAEDGSITRIYTSSTAPTSDLSDEELDEITEQVLELFPNFGRWMLDGHFRFLGHHVP